MTNKSDNVSKQINGILNINKPKGLSSHDVVNRVRRLLGIKKVGHTGTLDPMATGVLIVCLGQATKLTNYLMTSQKEYQATVRLGQTTNTYDTEGEIIATCSPNAISKQAVVQALNNFQGTIQQIPPPFSAIKKDGIPLYKLARQGIAVTPPVRQVHIEKIELLHFNLPELTIYITCQSGTYIRSIAHDLGQLLNVGAMLTQLVRVKNSHWHLKNAVSLEDVEQAIINNTFNNLLDSLEKGLSHLPSLIVSPQQEKQISYGQFITCPPNLAETTIVAYNQAGKLVALLTPRGPDLLKPKKVFI